MWLVGAVAGLMLCAGVSAQWECPEISVRPAAECSCDLPFTIRCAGDHTALQIIGRHLRAERIKDKNKVISLLDLSLRGVTALSTASVSELSGLDLQGLVISSGEIRRVQQSAFKSVASTIVALGLPNNQLPTVPTEALNDLLMLERLDLSNNKITMIEPHSFMGLDHLVFLDVSDNQIKDIVIGSFNPLVNLAVLRLRGNLLTVSSLYSLKGAVKLQGLDLSGNSLSGSLGPNTLPPFKKLTTLQISDNSFNSIKKECLFGSPAIIHLDLHNNQVDVLEDYAFIHLVNLTHLDLAQNDIVAVSGSSLAQLDNLEHLDLSHNYLRSLSAEPFKSLTSLTELLLHDNDISIVEDGALALHSNLVRFSVEDNPLNCDCSMASFARWLRDAKYLPQEDKKDAACATPPHLEGALIYQLSKNKLCDDFALEQEEQVIKSRVIKQYSDKYERGITKDPTVFDDLAYGGGGGGGAGGGDFTDDELYDYEFKDEIRDDDTDGGAADGGGGDGEGGTGSSGGAGSIGSPGAAGSVGGASSMVGVSDNEDLPISKAKVYLVKAWYEGDDVHLAWRLDPPSNRPHKCAGVAISRPGEPSTHVPCHNAPPSDVILRGLKFDPNTFYVFCIALEKIDSDNRPAELVLGCNKSRLVGRKTTFGTLGHQATIPTEATAEIIHFFENVITDKSGTETNTIEQYKPTKPMGTIKSVAHTTTATAATVATVSFNHKNTSVFFDNHTTEMDTIDYKDLIEPGKNHDHPNVLRGYLKPEEVTYKFKKMEKDKKFNGNLNNRKADAFLDPTKLYIHFDSKRPGTNKKTVDKWVNFMAESITPEIMRVSEVRSNVTSDGKLTIVVSIESVSVEPPVSDLSVTGLPSLSKFINCYVIIAVKTKGYLVAQKDTPCSNTLRIAMDGFINGPYEVCAKISKSNDLKTNPICIVPQFVDSIVSAGIKTGIRGLNAVLITAVLIMLVMILALAMFIRRMIKKPTVYEPNEHYIYYRQATLAEEPKSYVMLSPAKT